MPAATAAAPRKTKRDALSEKQRKNRRFESGLAMRSSYEPRWKRAAAYIRPTRPQFADTESNKGDRSNTKILDTTAAEAGEVATAGLLAMLCSPSRPWFEIGLGIGQESEEGEVDTKVWLRALRDAGLAWMDRSNFYSVQADLIRDSLDFATGAYGIFEDTIKVIRCQSYPIGSYWIDQDDEGTVHTFGTESTFSADQLVERFGYEKCSERIRSAYDDNKPDVTVVVRHMIEPNKQGDPRKRQYASRFAAFSECYWEKGSSSSEGDSGDDYLYEGGYDEFPIIVGRYERNTEDRYGTSCPGFVSLPDNIMLQQMQRKSLNAMEKQLDPPLVGGTTYTSRIVSTMPGEITTGDPMSPEQGLRPIYQTNFDVTRVEEKIARVQDSVRSKYKVRLFLQWALDARQQPATAAEVYAREKEKLILGPLQERFADDVFDKAILRIFRILFRRSLPAWQSEDEAVQKDALIPKPPGGINLSALRLEYISEIAVAQRQVGLTAIERHAAFGMQLAQGFGPAVLDNIDADKMMREDAQILNVAPVVSRSPEDIAEMREQRLAQQQQAVAAEQATQVAGAAKDLSAAKMGDDSVLSRLLLAGGRVPA